MLKEWKCSDNTEFSNEHGSGYPQGTRANLSFQSMKPLRYVTVFPECSSLELHNTILG